MKKNVNFVHNLSLVFKYEMKTRAAILKLICCVSHLTNDEIKIDIKKSMFLSAEYLKVLLSLMMII